MARFLAKWVTGGEGPGVEELEKVRAHLWVVLGRREVLGGGGSMEQGGRRQWPLGAATLRREGAVMAGLRSFTGTTRYHSRG